MRKRKVQAHKGKALFIRNPLARELARKINRAKLDEILARVDALPILDNRSMDEILGYDEFGLPS